MQKKTLTLGDITIEAEVAEGCDIAYGGVSTEAKTDRLFEIRDDSGNAIARIKVHLEH